ncbi:TonB-dependent receptor [Thermaurantiacus tibetensis]|uniref:TonB-dependent receptor n=1 Tax=Thermaurantiacus tibetensis TaxID=2759035 RepID=UPI0018909EBE|nr:TonB-dependent receptor [Thermaurantiacus tibetensis]
MSTHAARATLRASTLASTLLASLVTGLAPARAQQAPAPAIAEGEATDIVVTARRREESLVDVPISLSVVAGATLEAQGAPDITALQRQTPNLTLEVARGSNSTLIGFIRGVGQQDPLWGFEPGVGLYVDDVYIARPQGAVLDILDMDRIEVLRGPQGTLYGRNTIGGAIKYVTRRLGRDPSLMVRGQFGSYGQADAVVRASLPLGETLAVGGAVGWYNRNGFGENLTTGAAHYDKDVLAFRAAAEWTPGDRLFLRLAGDRMVDTSNPRHGHREIGFAGNPVFAPLPSKYDTRAGLGDDNRVTTWGVSATAEFTASDALTLKSITAYRGSRTDTLIDFDNTPGPVLDVPAFYEDWQFTQEVQALLSLGRLQGVAGVFYLEGNAAGAFDTVLGGANLTILTSGDVDTRSIALFGDLSYALTERLTLSAGLRWTEDRKEGTVFRRNFTGIRSPLFGNPAAIPGLVRTDYTNDRTDDRVTPRISATYALTPEVNVYASWGKGFKSGGFDMRGDALFTPTTVNGYAPETIGTVEAGLKGSFLDRSLFVALAGFRSNYRDQQVTIQVPNALGGIASFVDNAGQLVIWGFEAEATARLPMGVSANLGIGYTHGDYREFLTFIFGGTAPVDVSNERFLQNTPAWTINAGLTWEVALARGTLAVNPMLAFRDSYQLFEVKTPLLDEDGYVLVDVNINWTSANDRFRLGFHARNLTDARYRVGGYNFPGALFGDSVIGFYGPPRTFTGTVEWRY